MGTSPNTRTVWLFDVDRIRKAVASEKDLRGVTYADIERETGVGWTQIAGFATERGGVGIHGLVSLAMWANLDIRSLVVKQRNSPRHVASPQERELRALASYLGAAGLEASPGESPVEAAIRLLAAAKATGLLDEAVGETASE